ncbi:MAG: hypothetical protein V2B20_15505 [Pseudomonadota bacterium]
MSDLLVILAVAEVNYFHIWQTGAEQKLLSAYLNSGEDSGKPNIRFDERELEIER